MKKTATGLTIIALILCACGGKNTKSSSQSFFTSSSSENNSEHSLNVSDSSSSQQPSSSSVHVHIAGAPVEEYKIDATCTEPGSSELVTYCSECHIELLREPHIIPPKDHDYEFFPAKAATCTEGGWEPYSVCKRCGLSNKVETDPIGHSFVKNNDTLVYECEHSGCEATNGRDYAFSFSYPLPSAHVDDNYDDFAPTCSFVNDDNALTLGWYIFELLNDDDSLYETITPESYGGNYVFPEESLDKKVRIISYIVVLNDKSVKYSDDGNEIANLQYLDLESNVIKENPMTSTWFDGTSRKGFGFSLDLGVVLE